MIKNNLYLELNIELNVSFMIPINFKEVVRRLYYKNCDGRVSIIPKELEIIWQEIKQ